MTSERVHDTDASVRNTSARATSRFHAGITPRSVMVILASLLLTAMIIQISEIIESNSRALHYIASHALPLPAIMVFVAILAIAAVVFALTRHHILTRAEMFCILFAMLIAAPLMGAGFWHGFVRLTATLPRTASFEKMDALSDNLWPHGENILDGALAEGNADALTFSGKVAWQDIQYNEGQRAPLITIAHTEDGDYSTARLKVPVDKDDQPFLLLREPYLVSVLVRGEDLGPGASYFCRLYYDEEEEFAEEIFAAADPPDVNFLQREGFLRLGSYGVVVPTTVRDHIYLEFGLSGAGTVSFRDTRFMSVGGLESLLRGRHMISQSEFDALYEDEKRGARAGNTGLVVRPDNMWSWAGIKFLATGYIPLHHWTKMVVSWGSYVMLILVATLAVAVIMRRQWVDNERYPMPIGQMAMALVGNDDGDNPFSAIWRNRIMWLGFGLALFWCLMKGWRQFNGDVPNMNISVQLKPYLEGAQWGQAWTDIYFNVYAIILALAIFMELNVLISIVIGFLLFRLQYSFGYNYLAMGKSVGSDIGQTTYPFASEQVIGAYVSYGLLVLFFTRRYLGKVLRAAIRGGTLEKSEQDSAKAPAIAGQGLPELFSYRTALLLLIGSFLGVFLWSKWVDIPPAGMLLYFGFLLLVCFVATRLRAECGTPFAAYFPHKAMVAMPMIGGMSLFAPKGIVFVTVSMAILTPLFLPAVFFLIPGFQFELVEFGRRLRLPRSHIVYTCLFGVLGGIFIGGWVFLSSTYGVGGDYVENRDVFRADRQAFETYSRELIRTTQSMIEEGAQSGGLEAESKPIETETWAYIFAGSTTALVTILRQMFASFWFHPIGLILGPTSMGQWVWGSALAAWIIRSLTLRLGGAVTVRTKLLPFFTGVFLASVATHAIMGGVHVLLHFFAPGVVRYGGLF